MTTTPTPETHEKYITVTRGLFPRGVIWFDRDEDQGLKDAAVKAMAADPARIDDETLAWVENNMMDTLDAAGAARWEKLMRLEGAGLTIAQRRSQIIAKWRGYGTPSWPALQVIAYAFAIAAIIIECQWYPFEVGANAVGDPLYGDIWAVTLEIKYTAPRSPSFEAAMLASVPATTNILFTLM